MGSVKGAARLRNPGKQSFLPPKSPFPSIAASAYGDYGFGGNRGSQNLREGNRHHQRTSSESFLIEEQPSWLDDLLNEPETPARRGAHRRSSSDSLTYLDGAYVCSNMDNLAEEECRQRKAMPSWGSQEFDQLRDAQHYFPEGNQFGRNSFDRQQSRVWESALNVGKYSNSVLAANERGLHPGSFDTKPMEPETFASLDAEKHEQDVSLKDSNTGLGKKEASQANHSPSESDTKRVKQQFAQRSRVRKLQYIAELEKSVQALQAEGLKVSAELEFLDQQNLILNLENKALKQRLDSLAQEQLVKCLQQEILEREIARLRLLLQQQQPPPTQQVPPSHVRTQSRDLDSQFAIMSLNHKEAMSSYLEHNAQK